MFCVSAQGFSLHAETSCASHQRQKLERLCRYITRPALGHKRLRRTLAGGSSSNSKPRIAMAPPISS
ncbi:MAG: hypothetical protein E2O77_10130 [Caldithrix sp.]|nr:MAG: hypothetical protein E2O77_10130 [Caldithrix sp.]